ncbi:TPA: helix-turn-helix transcriptional regulator, partial [Clostridioides difficile]|nr:helix-turn-helix transcriptional regulator [Clostridioides difficile]
MTNTFGNRLKDLRTEKRITGEEFGKILNVTKVAVSNWESDRRFPDQNTLKKIADYFDVSIDYLLGRSNIRYIADN